jgi:hypothetical protein
VLESSKLKQLLRKRLTGKDSESDTTQAVNDRANFEGSPNDPATNGYDYEPPGSLAPQDTSVSKLIIPAVRVDPWSIFWLILVSITGGIGILSYILLTAVPPAPDCEKLSILSTDSQRLSCAKLWAETDKKDQVLAALNVVKGWDQNSPLYFNGKKLSNDWSWQLIKITKQELIADGDLQKATNNFQAIPPYSEAYPDAKATLEKWQEQWQQGNEIDAKVQQFIQAGEWTQGADMLNTLKSVSHPYWNTTRFNQMSSQFVLEKEGWEHFQDAEIVAYGGTLEDYEQENKKNLAAGRPPKKVTRPKVTSNKDAVFYVIDPNILTKAIGLAAKVPPKTYLKDKATSLQEKWSKTIIAVAREKLRVQKYDEAIAIAKRVPKGLTIHAEAQKLIADATSGQNAIGIKGQNPSEQKPGDVLDNYMLLTRAQQAGAPGSIASMQSAVALASNIPNGQPLWEESQEFIKYWNQHIQLLNEQPTVDSAKAFAKRGDLARAIATGLKLPQDGIAYRNLKGELQQWQQTLTMLTIQRDKRVLKKATALHGSGQIASAIAMATQIPNDSPVYEEAQNIVKRWQQDLPAKP